MFMPIRLICSSVFAESCMVVTRNWEFYDNWDDCLAISQEKALILFEEPSVYHVKALCQEIKLEGREI